MSALWDGSVDYGGGNIDRDVHPRWRSTLLLFGRAWWALGRDFQAHRYRFRMIWGKCGCPVTCVRKPKNQHSDDVAGSIAEPLQNKQLAQLDRAATLIHHLRAFHQCEDHAGDEVCRVMAALNGLRTQNLNSVVEKEAE